jgi:hypothetical protein
MKGEISEPLVSTFERFEFDGWPLGQLATLGLVIAGVLLLLSWRDFVCAQRPIFVPLLLVFRLGAMAVLLFLLAGPSNVKVTQETTKRKVGVFVDTSGSMGIEDDGSDVVMASRWNESNDDALFRRLDRAETALRTAASLLELSVVRPDVLGLCREALGSAGNWLKGTEWKIPELGEMPVNAEERAVAAELLRAEVVAISDNVSRAADVDAAHSAVGRPQDRASRVTGWLDDSQRSWLRDLERRADVAYFSFGAGVAKLDSLRDLRRSRTDAEGTNLEALLREVSASHASGDLDAALIVTDGRQTIAGNPRRAAGGLVGCPTVFVPIGEHKVHRDIVIDEVQAPRFVLEEDLLEMSATVSAYGARGARLEVTVKDGGEVVVTQRIIARSDASHHRLPLRWKAGKKGANTLEVRVSTVEEEKNLENNVKVVSVSVIDDPQKLLLIDWYPRWEFRYLANLFRRDRTSSFQELMFNPMHAAPGREMRKRAEFPTNRAAYEKIKAVILGDVPPSVLTPSVQEQLKEYVVEQGGTLIVVAGDLAMPDAYAGQPLADILPVRRTDANLSAGRQLEVTSEGETSPAMQIESDPAASRFAWREVTEAMPIYDLSPWCVPKPTARVLLEAVPKMEGETHAFLSWHYVGRGRVVYMSAPVSYYLRYRRGDVYHHRFWGQLIRWAGSRDLSERTRCVGIEVDKEKISAGESAKLTLTLRQLDGTPVSNANVSISVQRQAVEMSELAINPDPTTAGRYVAELSHLPEGELRLIAKGGIVESLLESEGIVGDVGTTLMVEATVNEEMDNPQPELALLADVAANAGGIVSWPDAVPEAVSRWYLPPDVTETSESKAAWTQWPVFWLLVGLLGIEWIGRKLIGLV